jgi:glycosyltransferase involved in cell wall biosynthesis
LNRKPVISVVTVTFNADKYLQNTIESIRKQTYKNIEYIIIDGQSTDDTINIIKENNDIISQWISEPDNGLYDAMNKGITKAKGDYIWFINAGDEIYNENTLSNIFEHVENCVDVYFGHTMIIDEAGNEIGLRRLKPQKSLTWKSFIWGQLVSHQAFIAKLSIAPLFAPKYKYSADTDWQIKILKKSAYIRNTGLILCRFLEGGRSKKTIIPSLKERLVIMFKNYGIVAPILVHIAMVPRFLWFYFRHKRF